MKGMSEFLGLFMKIMQIFFVVIALVSVFFTITDYEINIIVSEGTRESILVAQAALSAPCLTIDAIDGYAVRGLFDESELTALSLVDANPSCLTYPKNMLLKFEGADMTAIEVGKKDIVIGQSVWYPVALQKTDGDIIPIIMQVSLEGVPEDVSEEDSGGSGGGVVAGNICTKPGEYVCLDSIDGSEVLENTGHEYIAKCVDLGDTNAIDAATIKSCETNYKSEELGDLGVLCSCAYDTWLGEQAICYDNVEECIEV